MILKIIEKDRVRYIDNVSNVSIEENENKICVKYKDCNNNKTVYLIDGKCKILNDNGIMIDTLEFTKNKKMFSIEYIIDYIEKNLLLVELKEEGRINWMNKEEREKFIKTIKLYPYQKKFLKYLIEGDFHRLPRGMGNSFLVKLYCRFLKMMTATNQMTNELFDIYRKDRNNIISLKECRKDSPEQVKAIMDTFNDSSSDILKLDMCDFD